MASGVRRVQVAAHKQSGAKGSASEKFEIAVAQEGAGLEEGEVTTWQDNRPHRRPT